MNSSKNLCLERMDRLNFLNSEFLYLYRYKKGNFARSNSLNEFKANHTTNDINIEEKANNLKRKEIEIKMKSYLN